MPLLPYKYIKEKVALPKITPRELAEKLSYYGLETQVVEYENNFYLKFDPFPNRPDLFSWQGIIGEIGILLNCQVNLINLPVINEGAEKPIDVVIATHNCHEFHLGLIKSIKIEESPAWIKEWLQANGIRSINNVIDATNLVILETGQPLHIFDYDALPEKKIVVCQVQEEEEIETIQEQKLMLNSKDMVVSSGGKIIDLAGIVGTKNFSLNSQSKNILIECADFNFEVIQKTTKRLNVSTVASQFFCRKINLFLPLKEVLRRVISLIVETYRGNLNSGTILSYQEKKKNLSIIAISHEFITRKVGQTLTVPVVENIWRQLKFSYQQKENIYYVTIPLSRSDITITEDLLEELLRVYDYNRVVSSLP